MTDFRHEVRSLAWFSAVLLNAVAWLGVLTVVANRPNPEVGMLLWTMIMWFGSVTLAVVAMPRRQYDRVVLCPNCQTVPCFKCCECGEEFFDSKYSRAHSQERMGPEIRTLRARLAEVRAAVPECPDHPKAGWVYITTEHAIQCRACNRVLSLRQNDSDYLLQE